MVKGKQLFVGVLIFLYIGSLQLSVINVFQTSFHMRFLLQFSALRHVNTVQEVLQLLVLSRLIFNCCFLEVK